MTTGSQYVNLAPTRIVGTQDIKDHFFDYVVAVARDVAARAYDKDGAFDVKLGLAGAGADKFSVTGTSKAADGTGRVIDPTLGTVTGIQFENAIAVTYYIALKSVDRPVGVQVNPRTFQPEFISWQETIGNAGTPDLVVDNGNGTITFRVNTITENGISNAGRSVLVYKKVLEKNATTPAIAIETRVMSFIGGHNVITTTGAFGQSTISTTPSDYGAILIGPWVQRNTSLDTVAGHFFVGTVTGAGAGNTPVTFNTGAQFLFTATLANLSDVLRLDAHNFLKVVVKADASDINEPQIAVHDQFDVEKFSVDEDGDVTTAGYILPQLDLNGFSVGTPSVRWSAMSSGHMSVSRNSGGVYFGATYDDGAPKIHLADQIFGTDNNFALAALGTQLAIIGADDGLSTVVDSFLIFIHSTFGIDGLIYAGRSFLPLSDTAYSIGRSITGSIRRWNEAHVKSYYTEDTTVGAGTVGRKWRLTNTLQELNVTATDSTHILTSTVASFQSSGIGFQPGIHAFANVFHRNLSAPANTKNWAWSVDTLGRLNLQTYNDALSSNPPLPPPNDWPIVIARSGTTVTSTTFNQHPVRIASQDMANGAMWWVNNSFFTPANAGHWQWSVDNAGTMSIKAYDDAESSWVGVLNIARTGNTPTSFQFNAPLLRLGAYDIGSDTSPWEWTYSKQLRATGLTAGFGQGAALVLNNKSASNAARQLWHFEGLGDNMVLQSWNTSYVGSSHVALEFVRINIGSLPLVTDVWFGENASPRFNDLYNLGDETTPLRWQNMYVSRMLSATGADSRLRITNTSAPAGSRVWTMYGGAADGRFNVEVRTDGDAGGIVALSINRTGTTVNDVRFVAPIVPGGAGGSLFPNGQSIGTTSTPWSELHIDGISSPNGIRWIGGHYSKWSRETDLATGDMAGGSYVSVPFTSSKGMRGIGHLPGTNAWTIARTGLYLISYSLVTAANPGGATPTGPGYWQGRWQLAGVTIEESKCGNVAIDAGVNSLNGLSHTFTVFCTAGQVLTLQVASFNLASPFTISAGLVGGEQQCTVSIVELPTK